MENLSIADVLSLQRSGRGYGYDEGYGCYHRGGRGMAATGIGLGAAGLGIAIFGGMAVAFGLNAASKARYKAAENAANGNSRAIEILAARAIQDDNRTNAINLDVNQTLRNLTGATAQGGSAASNALATAEAYALMNGGGSLNPLGSAIQNNCALRVQRVSERNCGCGCDD